MQPRIDIAKCAGAELESCRTCARKLAPSGPELAQNWTQPIFNNKGVCTLFASVQKYGQLYTGRGAA